MRAVVCDKYGPPEVLRLAEVEKPVPKDDEVLIKVVATTVHVGDTKVRALRPGMGAALDPLLKTFMRFVVSFTHPRRGILGMELSGVVEETGRDVTAFKKGDPVFCSTGNHFGAYAEYVCLPEDTPLVRKPANMSHEEAATIANGATTAHHVLRKAHIEPGQKVLVYGASGSVGTFAVQLARNAGARVVAVASPGNHDFLRSLGAHECVDYARDGWADALRGFDLVLEGAGGHTRSAAWSTLRAGGLLVAIAMPPVSDADGAPHGCRGATAQVVPNGERLRRITELLDAGKLKVTVDSVFPLEDCAAAHERSESRHARGKVLLAVAPR